MSTLQKYFKDVNKYPLLSKEEEELTLLKAKFGDEKAKQLLIVSNLRFVITIAKKFVLPNVSLEDLIQEGNIGLMKSIERYDSTKGVKFLSYAVWWIRQSIYFYLNENGRIVRLPLNKIRDNNKYTKEKDKIYSETGVDLIPDMDFNEIIQVNLDDTLNDSTFSALDVIQDTNSIEPDRELIISSLKEEIDYMLNSLEPREKEILKMYYGINYDRPKTLDEIGDILNLTRERIRQVKELTLNRLSLKPKFKNIIRYL